MSQVKIAHVKIEQEILDGEEVASDIILRSMSARDLYHVVELETSCGLSFWGREAYAEELERAEAVMLVVDERDSVGSLKQTRAFIAARLVSDELHINNIAVHQRSRGRGMGRALLVAALERGEVIGAKWAVLEVRAGNAAARRLYESVGFEILGRRKDYYAAPREDALVMGMNLVRGK